MATLEAVRSHIPAADDRAQLRVLTCGSVDDGKSTLLGRLLYDTQSVADDQMAALERESRRWGTQGERPDYALLLDGLSAEREQGITIDVAYRYFSSKRRSFIVADTPGHEQYTRNMATGASQADLAIILIDARKGVLAQTRRHAFIVATLGVRHAVLAINKMDLAGFAQERFDAIVAEFSRAAGVLNFESIVPIPLVARDGDNVAVRSERMAWFDGPTLLHHLETIEITPLAGGDSLVLPVQLVLRPHADFRGYAGTVAQGNVSVGDSVTALPSGRTGTVARVIGGGVDGVEARAGEAVTLALSTEIDIARGDVLATPGSSLTAATQVQATLLWMADDALSPARDYALLLGPATATARITAVRHAIDVDTYRERTAEMLALNEIGSVTLTLDRPLVTAPYRQNRALGAFILVDRASNQTVAMGVVDRVNAERASAGQGPLLGATGIRAGLAGAVLGGLTWAASGDPVLGAGIGAANMVLSALLDRVRPSFT